MTEPKRIKAIDLCSGAGGWACAARGLPIDIVLAIDFWDRACKTYQLNHPATEVICGDLRDESIQRQVLHCSQRVEIDLILGGIPCEWLSLYRNVSKGKGKVNAREIADQRRTLRSVLNLVKSIGPRWYCLEDVKGLVRHLPKNIPWTEIDSAGFSPQRRKRIYVGNFPRPEPMLNMSTLADRLRPGPYRIAPCAFPKVPTTRARFEPGKIALWRPNRKSYTICDPSSRHDGEFAIYDHALPGCKRQIEWQEAAALQGFPRNYLFFGNPGDVGKMIASAIQIDTGRAILQAIVREAGLQ